MPRKSASRSFGTVRKLPSGRWQARYWGPDERRYSARRADGKPLTFDTKGDADAWLTLRYSEILRNEWLSPAAPKTAPVMFEAYASAWLAGRDLAARTKDHYAQLLRDHIAPEFGDTAVPSITSAAVRTWYAGLGKKTGPTARAHAYSLVRTIMNTAVADDLVAANPCRVRGAGRTERVVQIRPASLAELEAITKEMPERLQLMVMLAAWCALRFGELAELRRADANVSSGVIHVRRGVVKTNAGQLVKSPKSRAGVRDVAVPPHLMVAVRDHLQRHVSVGRDSLLFTAAGGAQLTPSALYAFYFPARKVVGRSDLRFHDLRHTGAVLAASTGATLAELMARLGHSTPAAAMRYQHASQGRDRVIADALSKLVTGSVVDGPKRTRSR